jgi:hypothetical protein
MISITSTLGSLWHCTGIQHIDELVGEYIQILDSVAGNGKKYDHAQILKQDCECIDCIQ